MSEQEAARRIAEAQPFVPPPEPARKRQRQLDDAVAIDLAVERLNREFALCLVGNQALVLREAAGEDGRPDMSFLTSTAFRLWHANESYWAGGDAKTPIGDIWIAHAARRQYSGLAFAPDGAPPGWYNLWRGFDVEPAAVAPTTAFPTFYDHLLTNVAGGDEGLFRWIVGWFAHMVQRPAERIGTALVLRGKMGSGKTKVGEVVGSLFSRHYLLVDDPRYVVGNFNAHMVRCLLLQVDEGFWAGDKQAEGRLKGLVTSRYHMIERKGVDPVPVRNLVRLFVTSNEGWVVPAGMEERRFAVLDMSDHVMQNAEYFAAIDAEMAAGGRAALLHWLLTFDLSTVDLRRIPATSALFAQKVASLPLERAWWLDRLRQGSPFGSGDAWIDEAPIDALYGSYVHHAERVGARRKMVKEQFCIALAELLPAPPERVRPWQNVEEESGAVSRRRVWCYRLPPRAACREHFAGMMRYPMDWGSDDADPQ